MQLLHEWCWCLLLCVLTISAGFPTERRLRPSSVTLRRLWTWSHVLGNLSLYYWFKGQMCNTTCADHVYVLLSWLFSQCPRQISPKIRLCLPITSLKIPHLFWICIYVHSVFFHLYLYFLTRFQRKLIYQTLNWKWVSLNYYCCCLRLLLLFLCWFLLKVCLTWTGFPRGFMWKPSKQKR